MLKIIFGLFLSLLFTFAYGEWGKFEYIEEKPWVELESQVPSYPREENLLSFEVNTLSTNQFFIDASSISVGDDGVVRYSIVIKSASGAKNVSFEGIRCQSVETKIYAFGRNDGSWSRVKAPSWREITRTGSNTYTKTLYTDFFCPGLLTIRNPAEAINAFKKGMHQRATGD